MNRLVGKTTMALLFAVISATSEASPSCAVPPSGMTSWWPVPLDENLHTLYEGLTGTSDFKGQNDGFFVGESEYTSVGKVGSAFSFSESYVQVPNDTTLEAEAFTVDAWVRGSTPGPFRYLVAKGADGCEAASFGLYTGSSGGLQFYVYDGSSYYVTSAVAEDHIWDGEWHFIAATYDGSSILLYLDGEQIGSATGTGAIEYDIPLRDFSIGNYLGCPSLDFRFSGDLDEVEVFNRVLSQSEIQDLYVADSAGKCQRQVSIDIKPGSDPNSINLKSAGVIPLAILSDENFDATMVDPLTVDLNGAGVKLVGKNDEKPLCHFDDVNADGMLDLKCQVYTVDYIVELGQTVAIVKARTLDGEWIHGSDTATIVAD